MRASIETSIKLMYAAPFGLLLTGLDRAGIFLMTANFGFGGKANFEQMLGVCLHVAAAADMDYDPDDRHALCGCEQRFLQPQRSCGDETSATT